MLGAPRTIATIGGETVPIEELRDFLRVDGDHLDTEIANYRDASAVEIQRRTGYRIGRQTVEVAGDSWQDFEHLLIWPVQAITSVRYQDRSGNWSDLDLDTVELFGGEQEQGVRATFGQHLPPVRGAAATIIMRFEVGDEAIPQPLKWTLLLMCRAKLDGGVADVDHLLFDYSVNL